MGSKRKSYTMETEAENAPVEITIKLPVGAQFSAVVGHDQEIKAWFDVPNSGNKYNYKLLACKVESLLHSVYVADENCRFLGTVGMDDGVLEIFIKLDEEDTNDEKK